MNSFKYLSIVIPSKNRYDYAKNCIQTLINMHDEGLEIVVVDNSDDDFLEDWISAKNNSNGLIYIREKKFLTVVENFQIGIDAANGLYICTIGDDDCVNPEIMELVKWANKMNIDAITPKFIVDYTWPDLRSIKKNNIETGGSLRIKNFTQKITFPNVEKGMKRLARTCGTDLADAFYIPKIYYGIIKTKILRKAKIEVGSNFPGVSPDLSGAVTASNFIKSYCLIDYPIFIAGSSINSTAGQSALKKHHGDLTDQKHISRHAIDNWPSKIPKFFSVESVWSQSAYASLKGLKRNDLLAKFNYPRIYAYTFMFNRTYYRYVLTALSNKVREDKSNMPVELSKIFVEYLKYIFIRAKYFIKNKYDKLLKTTTDIKGIDNVGGASLALSSFLKSRSISLKKTLSHA